MKTPPVDKDEYFANPFWHRPVQPINLDFLSLAIYALMFVLVGILIGLSVAAKQGMEAFAFVFFVALMGCLWRDNKFALPRGKK